MRIEEYLQIYQLQKNGEKHLLELYKSNTVQYKKGRQFTYTSRIELK